jgi:hypothetical protein
MSGPQSTASWKAAMAVVQLIAVLIGIAVALWIFELVV